MNLGDIFKNAGPGPYNPNTNPEKFAEAAGHLHGALVEALVPTYHKLKEGDGQPLFDQASDDLAYLAQEQLISYDEKELIASVLSLLLRNPNRACTEPELQSILMELGRLENSSSRTPLGRSIASISRNSITHSRSVAVSEAAAGGGAPIATPFGRVVGADVAGAISGASLGFRIVPFWQGALAGALLGASLCTAAQLI
jgi:hypothetical protein